MKSKYRQVQMTFANVTEKHKGWDLNTQTELWTHLSELWNVSFIVCFVFGVSSLFSSQTPSVFIVSSFLSSPQKIVFNYDL